MTAMASIPLPNIVSSLTPRIKKLEQLKVFTDNELQALKRNRNAYRRQLAKPDWGYDDILDYTRYELDFLAVVREKKVDAALEEIRNHVTQTTANCIGKLFEILISRYPRHLQFWLLYIKFCQKMRDSITLLKLIENLLEVHADQPWVFCLASRCAKDDLRSLPKARDYLFKGIRAHPGYDGLYRDAFLLELSLAKAKYEDLVAESAKAKKDEEVETKEPVNIDYEKLRENVKLVYEAALARADSAELMIEFYHHVRQLPFTEPMACQILADLRRVFPLKEVTWNTLAQTKFELLADPNNQEKFKKIIEEGIEVYKHAVEVLNTPKMWDMYLKCVIDIHNDDTLELPYFRKNCLIMAFMAAWSEKQLTDQHFVIWSELKEDLDKQMKLLKLGTKSFPTSICLWSTMIMKRLHQRNEKAAWDMFKEALAHFRGDRASLSLPLWKLMINLHVQSPKKVEMLFEEGIKPNSGVGAELKPQYVEWAALKYGVVPRKLYSRIARARPFSQALHEKMIQLENHQVKPDRQELSKCYDLSVQQFGSTNVQVWLNYMQFENGSPNYQVKILKLKEKALETLKPELINQFNSEMLLFTISWFGSPKRVNPSRRNLRKSSGRGPKRKVPMSKSDCVKSKRLCS